MLLNLKADTVALVRITLIAIGFLIPIKAFNLHMILGILRGGGDTRFSFILEFLGVWGIGVPMAVFAGLYLKLNLPVVYLLVGLEEVVKFVLTGLRFRSGKWINDLTRNEKIEEK
ncbi:MAG: hypothetical protein DRP60_17910 [Spirochaetes bacterium]|nr:MAG: hypothetical protein DRP60_17910 [Spirochaetota bacterium]